MRSGDQAVDEVCSFLCDCIRSDSVGSIAIVEHAKFPKYYFQFYVCGICLDNGQEEADGRIDTQIVGPSNAESTDPEHLENFKLLLKSNWNNEGGNVGYTFGPWFEVEQVKALVQHARDVLLAMYSLSEKSKWQVNLMREGGS